MNDSINDTTCEKISSLIDGEQVIDKSLINSLLNDSEAKQKWAHYNLVSDVLNDRDHHTVDKSWFNELSAKIDKEPTILAPRRAHTFTRKVMKQITGFAVAASVALVAIVSIQQTQVANVEQTSNLAFAVNQPLFKSSAIKPVSLRLNKATESKLSGFLVSHYEHSVSGRMHGLMPYMRIVSVTPAERIVNEK